MALIDPLGVGLALLRQFQMAVLFHGDVTVGFQNGHGAADRGLGITQVLGYVDGADDALLLAQHQNGLQVVLTGLVQYHSRASFT